MIANYWAILASGLIPLVLGSIWYSPALFGNAWMKVAGKTKEELKGTNMPLVFIFTAILGIFLGVGLSGLTNHQTGLLQLFATHPDFTSEGSEIHAMYEHMMTQFGDRHRSFGHGALHGALAALMFALPIVSVNAMFERRGAKYIFIHFGYWLVCMCLIGGVVCHF